VFCPVTDVFPNALITAASLDTAIEVSVAEQ
jgi:hypothetical protein